MTGTATLWWQRAIGSVLIQTNTCTTGSTNPCCEEWHQPIPGRSATIPSLWIKSWHSSPQFQTKWIPLPHDLPTLPNLHKYGPTRTKSNSLHSLCQRGQWKNQELPKEEYEFISGQVNSWLPLELHQAKEGPHDDRGVIYQIPCLDCDKSYIGETGRTLITRLTKHQRSCKNGEVPRSRVAQHKVEDSYLIDWNESMA